jgi:hypothetical protein
MAFNCTIRVVQAEDALVCGTFEYTLQPHGPRCRLTYGPHEGYRGQRRLPSGEWSTPENIRDSASQALYLPHRWTLGDLEAAWHWWAEGEKVGRARGEDAALQRRRAHPWRRLRRWVRRRLRITA